VVVEALSSPKDLVRDTPEGDEFICLECELPHFTLDDKHTLATRKSDSSPSWDWSALLKPVWLLPILTSFRGQPPSPVARRQVLGFTTPE
jgi:hypothetical protein